MSLNETRMKTLSTIPRVFYHVKKHTVTFIHVVSVNSWFVLERLRTPSVSNPHRYFPCFQKVITPRGERRVGKDVAVRVYCRVKSPGVMSSWLDFLFFD